MPDFFTSLSGDTTSAGLSVLMILAKATVILLAALGVTRAMERGSAVSRHLVWFVALGSLLLIPALASWSPLRLAILPPVDAATAPAAAPAGEAAPGLAPVAPAPPSAGLPSVAAPPASPVAASSSATVNTVRSIVSPNTPWIGMLSDPKLLFAIWSTVALLFAGWLAYGAMSVHRIIRRSRRLDTAEWTSPLWEVADRLGLESAPRLVRSEDAKMPFACGLLTPTIVLPAECDGWTLDRRRAVLLHELAHVRRHDLVGHTVGRFACALYWFHPLVWTAAKRLRAESERACDDLALNCGARASDYAEHLLDIVTGVRHHATPAVALAMARRKEFEGRMLAILDPELRRGAPSRKQTAGLVSALAVLSLVVGAAVPVARAADGSVRPAGLTAATPARPAEADSFRDQEMSQSVRTVERKQTDVQTRAETTYLRQRDRDEIAKAAARGAAVGAEVGREIGMSVGKSVAGAMTGAITGAVPSEASIEAIVRGATTTQQSRGSDDRPALLATVLKTDTSASLRRVAAWGLANFADTDVAMDALANAVKTDRDAAVREMAAWALADAHHTTTVTEALTTALRRDASPRVRASAAWALGSIGDRDAVDELAKALDDTSRGVRMRAAWAIGSSEPKQAPKALLELLSDKDTEVRQLAAWALYNIQDPDAVPALDAAMRRETDKETQRALIRAMAATGEKSVDAIKRLIDSNDADVRSTAIRALAGGGSGGPWPWPWPEPRPHP
ncbi:MAG TPA: M56 family metallopeptidase [Gemmatimonadaceae bacterium]|nr:M56 family metallopeptidase [Gemmatimonadaceae bacterium]